jgi:4-amino-4-deoxy-L-arabinose transferase-like glycosyltransferase
MGGRRSFLLILALYLALATAYSLSLPLGEAPDEADHFAYARHLALNRSLPQGAAITQGKHPPLYHAAVAAVGAWTGMDFDWLRSNPDAFPLGPAAPPNFFVHTNLEAWPWQGGPLAMRLGRLLSVLLGAITVWAAWRLGRDCFAGAMEAGLLAGVFLATLPGFLFISGAVNNDNAAGACGGLALVIMAAIIGRGLSLGRSIGLGLVLGLGLLSKVGTLALWPLAALAMVGGLWPERRQARAWLRGLGHLVVGLGVGTLVASPWLLRNWRLYGDPLGWELVRATVDQRASPLGFADLVWLAKGLFGYFWGRFGAVGQVRLPAWAYLVALVLSLFLLAGAVIFWRRRLSDYGARFSVALLALAPLLTLASIVQYSTIALGTDQARLMWPAAAALGAWAGAGLAGWAEALRSRRLLPIASAVVMMTYALAALLLALRPAFAPPPAVASLAAAENLASFGDDFDLVAVQLPDRPLAVGETAAITLFWRARRPLGADLRPVVRLVHQDGWLAAERDHSPAQGRLSTDRWPAGEVIADTLTLAPNPAGGGEFALWLGVRPFRGEWLVARPAADGVFVRLGSLHFE